MITIGPKQIGNVKAHPSSSLPLNGNSTDRHSRSSPLEQTKNNNNNNKDAASPPVFNFRSRRQRAVQIGILLNLFTIASVGVLLLICNGNVSNFSKLMDVMTSDPPVPQSVSVQQHAHSNSPPPPLPPKLASLLQRPDQREPPRKPLIPPRRQRPVGGNGDVVFPKVKGPKGNATYGLWRMEQASLQILQRQLQLNLSNTTTILNDNDDTYFDNDNNDTNHSSFLDPLRLSKQQHVHFFAKAHEIRKLFHPSRLFRADLTQYGANIVTSEYAYVHIFKNGGTTMAAQTKRKHVHLSSPQVQLKKFFAVVRDPIDHFLSGWSECGERVRLGKLKQWSEAKAQNKSGVPDTFTYVPVRHDPSLSPAAVYNHRILQWLQVTQKMARLKVHRWKCQVHSFPQLNSLLNDRGVIWDQLEVIGELQELPALLTHVIGLPFNRQARTGRNATDNPFLQTYYPRRKDWISNTTLQALCDFLALDYYVLAYPLPEACEGMPSDGYNRQISVITLPDGKTNTTTNSNNKMDNTKKQSNNNSKKPVNTATQGRTRPTSGQTSFASSSSSLLVSSPLQAVMTTLEESAHQMLLDQSQKVFSKWVQRRNAKSSSNTK